MTSQLTRRQFIAGASLAAASAAGAAVIAQHPWAAVRRSIVPVVTRGPGTLVLVTLYGGNDGLNTVIPASSSLYVSGRPTLAYGPGEVLPLAEGLGLHPSLKGLKARWDSGHLAVVLGVGYPGPVRSHFRSMDIWQSASPETPVATGWIGRWLDTTGTDPMRALSLGATLPLALVGTRQTGTSISPAALAQPRQEGTPELAALWAPGRDRRNLEARVASSGADLLAVQRTLRQLLAASTPPPAATDLSAQLQLVARLIRAGATTTVYQVSLGGFDSHAAEKATHARLLAQLDDAVSGFFSALDGAAGLRPVTLLAYSEFGRRVAENASGGTDHGTAAPVFVVGSSVKGGRFFGAQPSLSDLDQGDLKYTTDFRSVYATVLAHVLGAEPQPVLGGRFPLLAFL